MDTDPLLIIRWIIGVGMLGFGGFCALANSLIFVTLPFRKDQEGGVSFIPIVGGVLLCLGLLIIPISGTAEWCWAGLLVDFGCVPLFAWAGLDSLFRRRSKSQ